MLLQANKNILCKNQIRIQNMYQQFKYEHLHISTITYMQLHYILHIRQ